MAELVLEHKPPVEHQVHAELGSAEHLLDLANAAFSNPSIRIRAHQREASAFFEAANDSNKQPTERYKNCLEAVLHLRKAALLIIQNGKYDPELLERFEREVLSNLEDKRPKGKLRYPHKLASGFIDEILEDAPRVGKLSFTGVRELKEELWKSLAELEMVYESEPELSLCFLRERFGVKANYDMFVRIPNGSVKSRPKINEQLIRDIDSSYETLQTLLNRRPIPGLSAPRFGESKVLFPILRIASFLSASGCTLASIFALRITGPVSELSISELFNSGMLFSGLLFGFSLSMAGMFYFRPRRQEKPSAADPAE